MLSFKNFLRESSYVWRPMPAAEWLKYPMRIDLFVDKYKSGEPFLTTDNKSVIFKQDPLILKNVLLRDRDTFNNSELLSIDGKIYKFRDIGKSPEFGGKGRGGDVKVENAAILSIRKQFDKIKEETGVGFINIRIKEPSGIKVYRITDVESTKGVPKSDFHLLDMNRNPVVWISHKGGRSPKDFQQWSGMSKSREPLIASHPEVMQFIRQINYLHPEGLSSGDNYWKVIKDRKLMNLAIYGQDFGKSLGIQNVSLLLHGVPKLKKANRVYEFVGGVHYNGENVGKPYQPILYVRYDSMHNYSGIANSRTMIYPRYKKPGTAIEIRGDSFDENIF